MGPKNFYNAVDQRKLGTDQIGMIREELDAMITLPPVTSEDQGKTVIVSDQGEWELGNIDPGTDLPDYSDSDAGKALMIDAEGALEWNHPAGIVKSFTGDSQMTSATVWDTSITSDSMIDVYTSVFGYNPTNIVAGNGYVTLSFAGGVDFSCKVVIR